MTQEEQRIAIAEACGWRCIDESPEFGKLWWRPPNGLGVCSSIPDYPNDLNAMHEAVGKLDKNELEAWYRNLTEVVRLSDPHAYGNARPQTQDAWIADAPADQRAEAFLRTIGKWKE